MKKAEESDAQSFGRSGKGGWQLIAGQEGTKTLHGFAKFGPAHAMGISEHVAKRNLRSPIVGGGHSSLFRQGARHIVFTSPKPTHGHRGEQRSRVRSAGQSLLKYAQGCRRPVGIAQCCSAQLRIFSAIVDDSRTIEFVKNRFELSGVGAPSPHPAGVHGFADLICACSAHFARQLVETFAGFLIRQVEKIHDPLQRSLKIVNPIVETKLKNLQRRTASQ